MKWGLYYVPEFISNVCTDDELARKNCVTPNLDNIIKSALL